MITMSWWWLLVVLLIGGVGGAMFATHNPLKAKKIDSIVDQGFDKAKREAEKGVELAKNKLDEVLKKEGS
jgi:hypothetical protein